MFDMNDPATRDAAIKAGIIRTAPSDPRQQRASQRSAIASAAHGVSTEARQHALTIVGALGNMEGTSDSHSFIRASAGQGGSGRQNAQAALTAQRQIVADATQTAQDELKALKPALLAVVVSIPDGVKPEQIADKKADLIAALEAAGQNGQNPNQRAQALLQQAMDSDDALMVYVICSPDVMGYRAQALGYSLPVLQQVYAQAQLKKVGLHPLLGAGAVPGAELISLLPQIAEAITGHAAAASQALNQLAAECALA